MDSANFEECSRLASMMERAAVAAKEPFSRSAFLCAFARHSTTFALFAEHSSQKLVGVVLCYLGFSAFSARATIRVAYLFVQKSMRKKGVARALLQQLETAAQHIGAQSLILELPDGVSDELRAVIARLGFDASTGIKYLDAPIEVKVEVLPTSSKKRRRTSKLAQSNEGNEGQAGVNFDDFSMNVQTLAQEVDPIIPTRERKKRTLRRSRSRQNSALDG